MLSKRNTKTMAVVGGNGERPVARLVVLDGPGRGRKYAIKGDAVIGRSVVCDVLIDEEEVSRQHARIVATEEGFRIKDLGSQNGTTVNGMPITDAPIHIGDKIQLAGKVVLVLARYNPTEQEILERQRLETLGRLAAGLAHDFNNMQAVITAGLDFMFNLSESGALSHDRIQATLRDMMRASEQAAELARSLMTYARSDAAGFQAVDVSNLCNEVMHFVRRTFSRTVEIEAAVEPDLMAVANEPELHQLLMNLCINARDAMPEGGVLSITARPVTPAELGGMDSPNASRVVLIEVR
ncbi:MAG: FHA domain-containing protein, partial [Myxococcales bacterium]|nr:FHA domain-containing protein [Myxococcales bacterium]